MSKATSLAVGAATLITGTVISGILLAVVPAQADPSPGQAAPSLSQADPSPGQADPRIGQADPTPGQADPSFDQAYPGIGQAKSAAGQYAPGYAPLKLCGIDVVAIPVGVMGTGQPTGC
jgi:hypothetical protein